MSQACSGACVQGKVDELVEQLRVAVVVPPTLEAAFRLVPRSAFSTLHAVCSLEIIADTASCLSLGRYAVAADQCIEDFQENLLRHAIAV